MYNLRDSGGGNLPRGNLLMDKAGNLFGAASEGGAAGLGTIFKLSRKPTGGWTYTVLYDFSQVQHDASPNGSLVMDLRAIHTARPRV